jgi:hypothetical protein
MTDTRSEAAVSPGEIVRRERLRAYRTLSQVSGAELRWLLEHGRCQALRSFVVDAKGPTLTGYA